MNLVPVADLNDICFRSKPQKIEKLWRWCREGRLPARKIGGEWFIDLDAFDKAQEPASEQPVTTRARLILDKLRLRVDNG